MDSSESKRSFIKMVLFLLTVRRHEQSPTASWNSDIGKRFEKVIFGWKAEGNQLVHLWSCIERTGKTQRCSRRTYKSDNFIDFNPKYQLVPLFMVGLDWAVQDYWIRRLDHRHQGDQRPLDEEFNLQFILYGKIQKRYQHWTELRDPLFLQEFKLCHEPNRSLIL